MKYKNFEKHLSESFLHDSAAVDTDALMASLGIPVALEPKRRVAWWMLTGLALLSLLVVGLYYFSNLSISAKGNDVLSTVSTATIIGENDDSSPVIAEDGELTNESQNNQESNNAEVITNQENSKPQLSDSNLSFVNATQLKESETKLATIGNTDSFESETTNSYLLSTQKESNTADFITVNRKAQVSEKVEIKREESISNQEDQNRQLDPFSTIDILETQVVFDDKLRGLAEPECPSFSYRIPWNIALLAEAGIMKPMKDLENVGISNPAFDLRDRNENSKEAIQIGLHAKVSRGKNPLYVRGGAAYTRIVEQMNEEYDYIELDTMRGLISITTSMTGDTVTAIYGDIVSETRFTGRSVKHYFLHLLDIPVAVGYELPIAGSFYIGAEAGVQFNIRTSGTGQIFRDVNDYPDFSEVTTKETKVGLSYFGGFHFGKHLSKRSSVQLSARFRYYPSRFSSVDPNIEQRYNLAGLHAGYVFRF